MGNEIKFGRWLLENASEYWSKGSLCWLYGERELDTDELYDIFLEEQGEGNKTQQSENTLPIHGVIDCTDLEHDFIEALNQLIDTQKKPTRERF